VKEAIGKWTLRPISRKSRYPILRKQVCFFSETYRNTNYIANDKITVVKELWQVIKQYFKK
jgi:hypothetical protein